MGKMIDNERNKWAASNGRFGVMAAVAPQQRQCKFETLYPAGSFVGAATTPSRWDVICNVGRQSATKQFCGLKTDICRMSGRSRKPIRVGETIKNRRNERIFLS